MAAKSRLLIFIVAYNAEKTLGSVLGRIPSGLLEGYETEILVIDDGSNDATFDLGHRASVSDGLPFPVRVLRNPVNQGYGGNQKLGYHYAIQEGFDLVALLHGDGQYAPECLPDLLAPFRDGAAAVFGSRMMKPGEARRGGMPLYKFAGNRILTWIENKLLNAHLSEFHSGYRIYSTRALSRIPFDRNSNNFHFDTEIIIQLLTARLPIVELPIPTFYGDEICYVNGVPYAFNVVVAAMKARMQTLGVLYDRKFDCAPIQIPKYAAKRNSDSPQALCVSRVPEGSRVLDLGCDGGDLGARLREEKGCVVDEWALPPDGAESGVDEALLHDLNTGLPDLDWNRYDRVLLLDVIEHLNRPEEFLDSLRRALALNPKAEVMISTANVAFFITRFMMLFGQFNYGKRGILDLTHRRLFTFGSFRRAVTQAGFDILETRGVPGPYPLALGDNWLSRALLGVNRLLIHVSKGLFSYQILLRIKPRPTLASLLRSAMDESVVRRAKSHAAGLSR